MDSSNERREHQRAEVYLEVRIEGQDDHFLTKAVSLDRQGLRYLHPGGAPPKQGDEVMLEVFLPDEDEAIHTLSCVAGVSDDGGVPAVSVTFFDLPDQDAARVEQSVREAENEFLNIGHEIERLLAKQKRIGQELEWLSLIQITIGENQWDFPENTDE